MASISATYVTYGTSARPSIMANQRAGRTQTPNLVNVGWGKIALHLLRTSRSRGLFCAAKPETVDKVYDVVRKQLALSPETELSPGTKFSELGADSLDTVEIVMGLEEEFDISVEEESSENITTIQEAADVIEKLVAKQAAS